jgi:hypothetical protein
MIHLNFILEPFHDPFGWRYCFHNGQNAQQTKTDTQETQQGLQQNQALTNDAQGTLSQFEGPVQNSPFYKALLTQGTEQTSNAYGNAQANQRQQANMSGFGYNSPTAQGGQAQLQSQEAGALAAEPQQAMTQAAQSALQAAGETGQLAGQQGQMATSFNNAAQQEQQNSLWNRLWGGPNQSNTF